MGPYALEGSNVMFKFVVKNIGTAPLTNISLTDTDFDLTSCTIPLTLAVNASFECQVPTTAALGQHTDTATTSGSFTDGAGNTESGSDTDDANYFGMPKVRVNKTVNQKPFSGPELTFQIRTGAAPVFGQVGTIQETRYANVANNGQVVFDNLYLPGTYQLCEIVPEGYVPSYIWGTYGTEWFKPGYAPGQGGLDPTILVCVNFTIQTDGTLNFQNGQQIVPPGDSIDIDNQVGQMPRTIGYWKNHSSASGSNGGQDPVLDQMLYKLTQSGYTLQIGTLMLPGGSTPDDAGLSADYAVRLLNKSRIDNGRKMASDPCFNLAAQLVAYRLNQPFGAWPDSVAAAAADYAQAMLLAEKFDGKTHDRLSTKAIANLNYLATVLDAYNNNTLTITQLQLPYEGVYK
jgi:hypothetical protein